MRIGHTYKLLCLCLLFSLTSASIKAEGVSAESSQMLPNALGDFRALSAPRPFETHSGERPEDSGALSTAWRQYTLAGGKPFRVGVIKTRSDSVAYAFLTDAVQEARKQSAQVDRVEGVGTAAFAFRQRLAFFKGPNFVVLDGTETGSDNPELLIFARLFADTLEKGEGDIPVLVKHLPNWEQVEDQAIYAVTPRSLQEAAGNRPVLDAVSFEGGTEAVTATYGPSRMVLVEYTTPQIAGDSDRQIQAKIKELRDAGQPVPTAYKRVGNYSVFVFDAPDEQTAEQLINGVTYEQVVQWLGENPHLLERAQRYYTQVTSGVLIAVLKASGLSVLLCFGVGGLFGWLVFKRRRARQALADAYSDAGGIVRLNLDELTPQTDSSRLLGKGDG